MILNSSSTEFASRVTMGKLPISVQASAFLIYKMGIIVVPPFGGC